MRMDSTDSDSEEYFESVDDTLSSPSDCESAGEGKRNQKEKRDPDDSMRRISKASLHLSSKYDIWKSSPGSVLERRQQLFMRMGLKGEPHEPIKGRIIPDSASGAGMQSNVVHTKVEGGRVENKMRKSVFKESGMHLAIRRDDAWPMVRSRSDGASFSLQNGITAVNSSLRLARSVSSSPMTHMSGQDRLVDRSGAVLHTSGNKHGYLSSKPPLGVKKTGAYSSLVTTLSGENLIIRKAQSYWSRLGWLKPTDKSGNVPACADVEKSVENTALRDKAGSQTSAHENVLCRIKDLDSGREFVVNKVGKDGLWNKLKELDTGRELTWEEFETSLGLCPIVQEVMKRERTAVENGETQTAVGIGIQKKRTGFLKTFKRIVNGSRDKGTQSYHESGSDDKEVSAGRRSGSATDDACSITTKRIKVRAHKKAIKEFADLHLRQEFQAHQGAIWTMKFSLDGCYLASAGQDRVVRVWDVIVRNSAGRDSPDTFGEMYGRSVSHVPDIAKKNGKRDFCTKKAGSTHSALLPKLFLLSDASKCSFEGHTEDILDLSWSPSQSLLSSSMDKTVRLWSICSRECLRIFTHNDYVTCIQFNPINDGYFISGSLDGKVRIWSVHERQVVDWADVSEMVTAASYSTDGQEAVVGSYKGTCRVYKASGNKLQLDTTFDVHSNKNKRSSGKKITGFQFIPGDEGKILITSSDSRIWVYNGTEMCSKYKGFRNAKSQISASCSSNGKYVVCASEDSRVCIWNHHDLSLARVTSRKGFSGCYEDFSARHVLVAIPWPGMANLNGHIAPTKSNSLLSKSKNYLSEANLLDSVHSPLSISSDYLEASCNGVEYSTHTVTSGLLQGDIVSSGLDSVNCTSSNGKDPTRRSCATYLLDTYLEDCCGESVFFKGMAGQRAGHHGIFAESRGSATWPEEKLPVNCADDASDSNYAEGSVKNVVTAVTSSAWGFVIVTAGLEGEIQTFQNYSFPVRL